MRAFNDKNVFLKGGELGEAGGTGKLDTVGNLHVGQPTDEEIATVLCISWRQEDYLHCQFSVKNKMQEIK